MMYYSIARCRPFPPSMALVKLFLIVCTNHSAWPLDCTLVGDVLYVPHPHEVFEFL